MSEPQQQPTKTHEDAHGKVYHTVCPRCGRQVAERQPGEAKCVCGARVELKA